MKISLDTRCSIEVLGLALFIMIKKHPQNVLLVIYVKRLNKPLKVPKVYLVFSLWMCVSLIERALCRHLISGADTFNRLNH